MDGKKKLLYLFVSIVFLLAYIKTFLHYFDIKNLPVAHEYQYHFYNEARRIDFLRRSIRVFEFTQRMVSGWKTDRILVSDPERYVQENLRRCEILDFVKRVFPSYPWSLPTLARRLSYFKISYIDASVDVEMVKNIVKMNSVALENCLDIG